MLEMVLGAAVVVAALVLLLDRLGTRRGSPLVRPVPITNATRRAAMTAVVAVATVTLLPGLVPWAARGFFAFCEVCPLTVSGGGPTSAAGFVRALLLASWYYAATVVPVFILACLASGALLANTDRIRVRGPVASFGLAAALPVCACGAVPIGRAMAERDAAGVRDGLVFLVTAPLLSPIVVLLGLRILGPAYVIARVVASAALAALAVRIIAPQLRARMRERREREASVGTSDSRAAALPPLRKSVLLEGWRVLAALLPYVLFGIVLGALFAAALPSEYLGKLLRPGVTTMAAAVVAGIPANMCAGEEVLLMGPLVGAGLPLGHALAFSLAGTGICLSSMPLLAAAIGRKATGLLVALYLVVPFASGLVFDVLPDSWIGGAGGP